MKKKNLLRSTIFGGLFLFALTSCDSTILGDYYETNALQQKNSFETNYKINEIETTDINYLDDFYYYSSFNGLTVYQSIHTGNKFQTLYKLQKHYIPEYGDIYCEVDDRNLVRNFIDAYGKNIETTRALYFNDISYNLTWSYHKAIVALDSLEYERTVRDNFVKGEAKLDVITYGNLYLHGQPIFDDGLLYKFDKDNNFSFDRISPTTIFENEIDSPYDDVRITRLSDKKIRVSRPDQQPLLYRYNKESSFSNCDFIIEGDEPIEYREPYYEFKYGVDDDKKLQVFIEPGNSEYINDFDFIYRGSTYKINYFYNGSNHKLNLIPQYHLYNSDHSRVLLVGYKFTDDGDISNKGYISEFDGSGFTALSSDVSVLNDIMHTYEFKAERRDLDDATLMVLDDNICITKNRDNTIIKIETGSNRNSMKVTNLTFFFSKYNNKYFFVTDKDDHKSVFSVNLTTLILKEESKSFTKWLNLDIPLYVESENRVMLGDKFLGNLVNEYLNLERTTEEVSGDLRIVHNVLKLENKYIDVVYTRPTEIK